MVQYTLEWFPFHIEIKVGIHIEYMSRVFFGNIFLNRTSLRKVDSTRFIYLICVIQNDNLKSVLVLHVFYSPNDHTSRIMKLSLLIS